MIKDEVIVRIVVNKEERKRIVQTIHAGSRKGPEAIAVGDHIGQDKGIGKIMERCVLLCVMPIMLSYIMH